MLDTLLVIYLTVISGPHYAHVLEGDNIGTFILGQDTCMVHTPELFYMEKTRLSGGHTYRLSDGSTVTRINPIQIEYYDRQTRRRYRYTVQNIRDRA
jgi:hypothetical protein